MIMQYALGSQVPLQVIISVKPVEVIMDMTWNRAFLSGTRGEMTKSMNTTMDDMEASRRKLPFPVVQVNAWSFYQGK